MYDQFYKFRCKPFSPLPDPRFLFLSKKHRLALSMLQYGLLNQVGFTTFTGEIGSGKTTLIHHILKEIREDVTVGLVSNTHHSFDELLQWALLALKQGCRGGSKVELYEALGDFLLREYEHDRRTVLIIDEAQNLAPEALEELRMLSNINTDGNQVLQLILVGQPGLRETLQHPSLHQFARRIGVEHHLQRLDLEETWQYIQHRLTVAGGDPELFDTAGCAAIYYYTQGTPRLINLLCDTALACGFAEQRRRIGADLICEVMRYKRMGGIFPLSQEAQPKDSGAAYDFQAAEETSTP